MRIGTSKRITLVILVILVSFLILAPVVSLAAGLVPCGLSEDDPDTAWDDTVDCDLCGFLWLIKNVMDLIFKLGGTICFLIVVAGAIIFLVAGGSTNLLAIGKKIFLSAVIGLVIILCSWLIISAVFGATGYNAAGDWHKFECEGLAPPPPPSHLVCQNGSCIEVESEGSDECDRNEDCYHLVCSGGMCQKENTPGTNECSNEGYSCAVECNNGIDDDGDGKIDHPADPGCTSPGDNSETEVPYIPECSDWADNDGDGKIDFGGSPDNDSGCESTLDNSETNPNIQCDDGEDNDGDGRTDWRPKLNPDDYCSTPGDLGCENLWDNNEGDDPECGNCIDDDEDGLIDMLDPGCMADPSSESNSNIQCDNGFDDDGDTRIDFKIDDSGDPQCTSPVDNDEANGTGIPACQDGIDNDGDGTADFNGVPDTYSPDPGCISFNDTSEKELNGPQCDDGVNNDDPQDNLADYKVDGSGDPQCTGPGDNDEWNGVEACDDDTDCDLGKICEPIYDSEKTCVPGCHEDPDCPSGQICVSGSCQNGCRDCQAGQKPVCYKRHDRCQDPDNCTGSEIKCCGNCVCKCGNWWECLLGDDYCYPSEVKPQCDDEEDNDGDFYIDFPSDPGCTSADDNDEKEENPFEGYDTWQIKDEQKDHASQALIALLACMESKLSADAKEISSISDDGILADPPTCDYLNCSGNVCGGCSGCAHVCNSCHYGGKNCNTQERFSYAVDFAKEGYCDEIKTAALECNADAFVNYEGNHVHVSLNKTSGCECNEPETGEPCP